MAISYVCKMFMKLTAGVKAIKLISFVTDIEDKEARLFALKSLSSQV
jgi:hypothetical protein